jgi:hypothetical protein
MGDASFRTKRAAAMPASAPDSCLTYSPRHRVCQTRAGTAHSRYLVKGP